MRKLQIQDKVISSYKAYWQEHPELFDAASSAAIRGKYAELERQLRDLLCADAELERLVQEKMSVLRARIGKTRHGGVQIAVTIQVNKYTNEKDIIRMVKTAKRAVHLLKKSGDAHY